MKDILNMLIVDLKTQIVNLILKIYYKAVTCCDKRLMNLW
jgi:hypothetical protein